MHHAPQWHNQRGGAAWYPACARLVFHQGAAGVGQLIFPVAGVFWARFSRFEAPEAWIPGLARAAPPKIVLSTCSWLQRVAFLKYVPSGGRSAHLSDRGSFLGVRFEAPETWIERCATVREIRAGCPCLRCTPANCARGGGGGEQGVSLGNVLTTDRTAAPFNSQHVYLDVCNTLIKENVQSSPHQKKPACSFDGEVPSLPPS